MMTVPVIPEGQGPEVNEPEVTAPEQQQENLPPWASDLETLPESVRPLVEPLFKKWDADVTQRFQSLHSEYDPYKQFIDDYEPDALAQAVAVMDMLSENPQELVQRITQAYGLQAPEQGTVNSTPEGVDDLTPDDPYAERFSKMEDMLGKLAQRLIEQQEAEEASQQEQELEKFVSGLHEKHGEFDELYVLTLMSQGVDPDQAISTWKNSLNDYASKLQAPNNNAPTVVSATGGYPSEPIQTKDLSDKATKDLVVQMLAQAAANQQ